MRVLCELVGVGMYLTSPAVPPQVPEVPKIVKHQVALRGSSPLVHLSDPTHNYRSDQGSSGVSLQDPGSRGEVWSWSWVLNPCLVSRGLSLSFSLSLLPRCSLRTCRDKTL